MYKGYTQVFSYGIWFGRVILGAVWLKNRDGISDSLKGRQGTIPSSSSSTFPRSQERGEMLRQRLAAGRALFKSWRSLGGGGGDAFRAVSIPNLKRKASNSWSAVQDTYLSTKEVFERHRVVFTVGTSVASVLTAWAGYSIRQVHQSRMEERLQSVEHAIKNNFAVEHEEIKKIVGSRSVGTAACIATALTSSVIGYALGWRGGAWFARRKFRREQLKLMGQLKPYRLQLLARPFMRFRNSRSSTASPVAHKAGSSPLPSEAQSLF